MPVISEFSKRSNKSGIKNLNSLSYTLTDVINETSMVVVVGQVRKDYIMFPLFIILFSLNAFGSQVSNSFSDAEESQKKLSVKLSPLLEERKNGCSTNGKHPELIIKAPDSTEVELKNGQDEAKSEESPQTLSEEALTDSSDSQYDSDEDNILASDDELYTNGNPFGWPEERHRFHYSILGKAILITLNRANIMDDSTLRILEEEGELEPYIPRRAVSQAIQAIDRYILGCVEKNKLIKKLSIFLSNNVISDDGAEQLVLYLRTLNLKDVSIYLKLQHNDINFDGFKSLLELLKQTSNIQKIYLKGNPGVDNGSLDDLIKELNLSLEEQKKVSG